MKTRKLLAAVLGSAMVLSFASIAAADHTIDLGTSGTLQSGSCPGDYFKIEDASALAEGEHDYTGTTKNGNPWSATLDVTFDGSGDVDTIEIIAMDPAYVSAIVKAGNDFFTENDTFLGPYEHAISDVTFCLGDAPPTEPPPPEPPPTEPPPTEPPPTEPPPTEPPPTEPPPTEPPATATPTLPPTATSPEPSTPSSANLNLVLGLIVLVAGGLTAYAMRPKRATNR